MNQQPDKFFRQKLGSYHKPAPAEAWARISANLDKKNDSRLWLKVAASLLLLAMAAAFLWPREDSSSMANLPSKPEVPKQVTPLPEATVPEKHASKADAMPPTQPSKVAPAKVKRERRGAQPAANVNEGEAAPIVDVPPPAVQEPEVEVAVAIAEVDAEDTGAATEAGADPGVTLVYTADEVNEKYLDKKALAEATSKGKKPSTLRKLLTKAYDLKHNQDPFGDLRQKKNEILALNFIGEKQRSQNK